MRLQLWLATGQPAGKLNKLTTKRPEAGSVEGGLNQENRDAWDAKVRTMQEKYKQESPAIRRWIEFKQIENLGEKLPTQRGSGAEVLKKALKEHPDVKVWEAMVYSR